MFPSRYSDVIIQNGDPLPCVLLSPCEPSDIANLDSIPLLANLKMY